MAERDILEILALDLEEKRQTGFLRQASHIETVLKDYQSKLSFLREIRIEANDKPYSLKASE
jgi:hypothetical protein